MVIKEISIYSRERLWSSFSPTFLWEAYFSSFRLLIFFSLWSQLESYIVFICWRNNISFEDSFTESYKIGIYFTLILMFFCWCHEYDDIIHCLFYIKYKAAMVVLVKPIYIITGDHRNYKNWLKQTKLRFFFIYSKNIYLSSYLH